MNQKLSLKQIVDRISDKSGVSVDVVEAFVKEYFFEVAQMIATGEQVEIPSIGKFSLRKDSPDPIEFVPDMEFAAQINQPFQMFSPEVITADINEADIQPMDVTEISLDVPVMNESDIKESGSELIADTALQEEIAESDVLNSVTTEDVKEKSSSIEENISVVSNTDTNDTEIEAIPNLTEIESLPEDQEEFVEQIVVKSNFTVGLITGLFIGLALGAIAFTIYILYLA